MGGHHLRAGPRPGTQSTQSTVDARCRPGAAAPQAGPGPAPIMVDAEPAGAERSQGGSQRWRVPWSGRVEAEEHGRGTRPDGPAGAGTGAANQSSGAPTGHDHERSAHHRSGRGGVGLGVDDHDVGGSEGGAVDRRRDPAEQAPAEPAVGERVPRARPCGRARWCWTGSGGEPGGRRGGRGSRRPRRRVSGRRRRPSSSRQERSTRSTNPGRSHGRDARRTRAAVSTPSGRLQTWMLAPWAARPSRSTRTRGWSCSSKVPKKTTSRPGSTEPTLTGRAHETQVLVSSRPSCRRSAGRWRSRRRS